nr:NEP1-interacting protein-like 2 [Ipomoea batatas]
MELVHHCLCGHDRGFSAQACASCGSISFPPATLVGSDVPDFHEEGSRDRELTLNQYLLSLITSTASLALTVIFVIVGALLGAVFGALAGWAAKSGVFRGAGLCTIAGAVLSLEVLEASHAYWCSECCGSHRSSSSLVDFIKELLHHRFVDGQFQQPVLRGYDQQGIINSSSDDYGGEVPLRGLSGDSLKNLPSHVLTSEVKAAETICCTICLQDVRVGETARNLPRCNHTFHLSCVDKWLARHASCPVCRRDV